MPSFHRDCILESEALPKHMVRVFSFRPSGLLLDFLDVSVKIPTLL